MLSGIRVPYCADMKRQLILAAVFSIIIFGSGFADRAFAVQGDPIPGVEVGLEGEDESITASGLGVDTVGTLPTSPFYFLKQWGRGFTRLFTFGSIAKAQLELNITNQIAAELQEVAKTSSTINYTGLERALKNYTDAQERLNFRITTINGTSNIVDAAKLLEDVDEKTAKHVELLQKLAERWDSDPYAEDSARKGSIGDPDFDLLAKGMKDALDNTRETFTATVSSGTGGGTPTGSVSFLMQKAADQIESATAAIEEANNALMGVSTTRGAWRPSTGGDVSQNVTVPKQTQGATFGEKAKVGDSDDTNKLDIFDRWGKSITKAKEHLTEAKKAFAEEKYGEAYGLARSAEAVASGVRVAVGDINGDGRADKTAPASPETSSKQKTKIGENESPKPETTKPVTEPDVQDTSTPQAKPEKAETSQSSGSSAGPSSNSDR